MTQPNENPSWLVRMMVEQPGMLLVVGMLPFLLLIAGMGMYLDGRIEEVEERITFVPPRSYEAPDLVAHAADPLPASLAVEQLVYVPTYSHVYYQEGSPYPLETTLSLRNVDDGHPVYFSRVDYYNTEGERVKTLLEKPIRIAPLETLEFLVERRDSSGGSGANFLVKWMSDAEVDRPLIEAVMVGTAGTQGICFSRQGIEVSQTAAAKADESE